MAAIGLLSMTTADALNAKRQTMKSRSSRKKKSANKLLEAIEFVSMAQDAKGNDMQSHCIISGRTVVASDGVLACGHLIEEDLEACPLTSEMILALSRCTDEFAITQLSEEQLQIRSGDFLGFVACCERSKLPQVNPDAALAPVSHSLTGALRFAAPLVDDKSKEIAKASIQLKSGSLLATNGIVVIEAWHGHDLPPILIPKSAAKAIIKSKKNLTAFGFGGHTATFWFEDNSWIRTQLFQDVWPDKVSSAIEKLFAIEACSRPFPEGFFDAVKKIQPFSSTVYCTRSYISSHPTMERGGHTVGIENGIIDRNYDTESLLSLARFATAFDDRAVDNATLFFGPGVRGAIVHTKPTKPASKCSNPECTGCCDICLPF